MTTQTANTATISDLAIQFAQAVRTMDSERMELREAKNKLGAVTGHYALWEFGKAEGEQTFIPGKDFPINAGKLGERLPTHLSVTVCFHKLVAPSEYAGIQVKKAASLTERIAALKADVARLEKLSGK